MVCKSFKNQVRLLLQSYLIFKSFTIVESHVSSFFTKIPFFKLDGDIIQTIAVPNIFECCWGCDRVPSCLSLNIADRPGIHGLYECQLLTNWTANIYSGLINPSQHYHHYIRLSVSTCGRGTVC